MICCAVRTPLCKAKRGAFKDSDVSDWEEPSQAKFLLGLLEGCQQHGMEWDLSKNQDMRLVGFTLMGGRQRGSCLPLNTVMFDKPQQSHRGTGWHFLTRLFFRPAGHCARTFVGGGLQRGREKRTH